jgi:hypothetical protein
VRPFAVHYRAGLAILYTMTGCWEQASTELSVAIAQSRAMEMTFGLPPTEAILAQAP